MPKRKLDEEGEDVDVTESQIPNAESQILSQTEQCVTLQESQPDSTEPLQNGRDHCSTEELQAPSEQNIVDTVESEVLNVYTAETNVCTGVDTVLSNSSVPDDTVAAKSEDLAAVNEIVSEQERDENTCVVESIENGEQKKTNSEIEEVTSTENQQHYDQPSCSISNQTQTLNGDVTMETRSESQMEQDVDESEPDLSPPRQRKRRVHFDGVTVYYFHRKQGFTCVPSMGGSTLGMDEQHAGIEEYSVAEYGRVQKAQHCEILLEQHQQGKIYLPPSKLQSVRKLMSNLESSASSTCSSEDEAAAGVSAPDVQPPPNKRRRTVDEDEEEEEEEVVVDEYYFLQPITTRQRRIMLRQAGIKKIDTSEKEDCKEIRGSREVCGCDCKVYCDPATCICAQADIQCQVDRMSFPCGCTKDGCANPKGRVEFNPIRVRTHFIHTLMRLETEKKCEEIKSKRKEGGHLGFEGCEENDGIAKITDCATGSVTGDIEGMDASTSAHNDSNQHFNSNERGSCCDCQNSEVNEFLMRESQYANSNSNSAMSAVDMDIGTQYNNVTAGATDVEEVLSAGVHEEAAILYNDEEEYSEAAANGSEAAALYHQFMKEESCSESSDCSSEGSAVEQEGSTTVPTASTSYNPGYQQYEVASDQTYIPDASSAAANCIDGASYTSNLPSSTAAAASPTYKLEPISQILNPIGVSAPVWNNTSPSAAVAAAVSSYCDYTAAAHHSQPISTSFQEPPQEEYVTAQESLLDLDKHAELIAAAATSDSKSTLSSSASFTTATLPKSPTTESMLTETSVPESSVPSSTELSSLEPSPTKQSSTEPSSREPSTTDLSDMDCGTEPLAMQPSFTEQNVTEPTTTEPSVTEITTTEPMTTTETPVTESPVKEMPVAETPVAETPVKEMPVAETPVAETPVVETPVAEPQVTESAVTETPVAESTVTKPPIAEPMVVESPVTEITVAEPTAAESTVIESAVTESAVTESAVTESAVTEATAIESSETEPLIGETSVVECQQASLSASPPACPASTTAAIDPPTDSAAPVQTNHCNGCTSELPPGTETPKTATDKAAKEGDTEDAETDSEDSGLGTEDQTHKSQNFGEIIKDSIVETVNA